MRTAGSFVLDTNIVIALIAKDEIVAGSLESARAVFLPSIVLGELYYGARSSAQRERNLAQVTDLAAEVPVLVPDATTAEEYGILKARLRAKGRLIPDNDIWVAAIALQHGLALVSRDAHFREIEGLDIETWQGEE
jgi:tRNA(fMet)-specific endonuclease VapC